MTVLEFVMDLAKKSGLDTTQAMFAPFLSSTTLREVTVPSEIIEAFNKSFLTRESALNDPEVYKNLDTKSKGKYFGILDNKVNQLLTAFNDFFTEDQKSEIKNETDTPKKYDLINKYLPVAVSEKSKTIDGKKASEADIRKIEEDFNNKAKTIQDALNTEWQAKFSEKEKEFKGKLINKDLSTKIFSYNLIDNIPGGKDFLADAMVKNLSSEYHLELNEKGGIELRSKDDPEKEVFVNNTKQTIDIVLNDKLKDWVKKSDNASSQHASPGAPSPFPVQSKPAHKMTLQEQNREKAQKEAEKLAKEYAS